MSLETKPDGFEDTTSFVSIKAIREFYKSTYTKQMIQDKIASGELRVGMPPRKSGHRSIFDLNLGKGQWRVKYIPEVLSQVR